MFQAQAAFTLDAASFCTLFRSQRAGAIYPKTWIRDEVSKEMGIIGKSSSREAVPMLEVLIPATQRR